MEVWKEVGGALRTSFFFLVAAAALFAFSRAFSRWLPRVMVVCGRIGWSIGAAQVLWEVGSCEEVVARR